MRAFVFISVLLLALAPLTARAESNLPRAFAPWMALEREASERRPVPREREIENFRPHLRPFATAEKNTKIPVITPEDTLELIEQIYNTGESTQTSALEDAYSKRVVDELQQFGYDLFGAKNKEKSAKNGTRENNNAPDFSLPAGAVQDSFLLNIGDKITVSFRGQRQDSKTYSIDGNGQLIIDDLMPVTAAGRPIGEVRESIKAQTDALHNTDVFVSLDAVNQVNVLIVGHVEHPGRQTMTVFHTVLDALMAAGGIEKTGSLRQIKLIRDGRSTVIDLYALLIHSSPIMDISLRDGDRIIVPPVGPTVGIAGGVKRPGIYEILPVLKGMEHDPLEASQKLSLNDLLDMAGGVLTPGRNRFLGMGVTKDGRETVAEVSNPLAPVFTDGAILMVAPADDMRTGTVELSGHTRRSGLHALDSAPSLSALLDDNSVFGPDIYPLIGVIERRDDQQLARKMISFPPLLVVRGKFDQRLQDGDIVHLFSRTQIMALQEKGRKSPLHREIAYGSADGGMGGLEEDLNEDPVISSFLEERAAFVRGAVRAQGSWPVAEGISLESLLAAAGGLTLEASTGDIEITTKQTGNTQRLAVDYRETDPSTILIGPGDSVRIKQKFRRVEDNSVLIIGQVQNPGRYDLVPGERLSELLVRAGGLTREAYPDGAIFSRESERRAEQTRFEAQAQALEVKLATTLQQKKQDDLDPAQIAAVQELAGQLRRAEAVGRITVEADPALLSVQPELDILLESGDRVYIPQRPLTVRVAGEILSPANLQFRKDKEPRDYIMEAGGFTYDADKDRVFVLYPDGSAQPLLVNNWNHMPVFIPPGSTIVVPRDPKPFDFIQAARDVSQILSNLAITGIFIDDLRNGN